MKYDVVIPSLYHVDGDYLKVCVESLRDSGFEGKIIVVTNGTPNKPDLKDIRGVTAHIHTTKQGQCAAVNIGAQFISDDAEYMLISNSDMYYAPGWDKYLKLASPVVSPNLVEPVNNAGSAHPFLKIDGGLNLDEFDKELVDENIKALVKQDHLEEPGFNFPVFIKRDLWKFLGGYDENYDPWGSNGDTDLQTRINLAGITPKRYRDVLVYHFSNKSGTFDGTHQEFYMNNIEYFKQKFGYDRDELGSDVWYNKDMIPEDKERIKYDQETYIPRLRSV